MSKIKLVVFDMAGTTVRDNHDVERCFAQAAQETDLQVSDDTILAVQGWSKKFVFEVLWTEQLGVGHPDLKGKVQDSYDVFKKALEDYYTTNGATLTNYCSETIQWLRDHGIYVALTTGFYRKVVDIILDKLGWFDKLDANYRGLPNSFIDLSIAGDEVPNGRPAPDMIFKAMHTFRIQDPKTVINIGDTPSDLESGKRASVLLSLGVINGTHTKEQLNKYPNDGLLQHLGELPEMLKPLL